MHVDRAARRRSRGKPPYEGSTDARVRLISSVVALRRCIVRLCRVLAVTWALLAVCLPAGASASGILGDRDVSAPTIGVNAKGIALVQYTTASGLARHVLVWGAVNAVANPTLGAKQQAFQFDYSGGWKSQKNSSYWKTFTDGCAPYDGPALPFFVAGCDAPDGSFWALQAWQRNLPMRGFDPWTAQQKAVELHVSHWTGDLPVLEIYQHWTYADRHQGFFGRLTYLGQPVFGTRTSSATVSDPFARNIYIDTFDSDYGPGWRHDTAIGTHSGDGGFCYTFVPQAPPAGYPSTKPHGDGLGSQIRVSVMGPGVTPIVQWVGNRLTQIDSTAETDATQRFDSILGADRHCAPER